MTLRGGISDKVLNIKTAIDCRFRPGLSTAFVYSTSACCESR